MKQILNLMALVMVSAVVFSACKKSKEGKIVVYPNPATDYIVFDATGNSYKNGEITVKDMAGQVIKVFKTTDSSRIQWQVDTFHRGVYNYRYTADKMNTQTGKIQFN